MCSFRLYYRQFWLKLVILCPESTFRSISSQFWLLPFLEQLSTVLCLLGVSMELGLLVYVGCPLELFHILKCRPTNVHPLNRRFFFEVQYVLKSLKKLKRTAYSERQIYRFWSYLCTVRLFRPWIRSQSLPFSKNSMSTCPSTLSSLANHCSMMVFHFSVSKISKKIFKYF